MKGQAQYVGLAVITFVIVTTIMGLGIERMLNLEERVYMNTLDVPAERVGVAIYAMDAVERGETQLEMPVEYGLNQQDSEKRINYSMETVTGDTKSKYVVLQSVGDFESGFYESPLEFELGEEGVSNTFCINKTSQKLELSSGGC